LKKKEYHMSKHFLRINRFLPGGGVKILMPGVLAVLLSLLLITACDRQKEEVSKTPVPAMAPQPVSPEVENNPQPLIDLSTAIEQVADKAIPAVAHIQVTQHQEIANPFLPYEENPFFRRFFDLPRKIPQKLERNLIGIGSGVIIDAEGHILTNYHVVGGATQIQVTLSDGIQYPAELVGVDPKTDLGVIRIIAGKPLPFLTFANSDEAKIGQWVVAIGHPRGLDQTVTQGIISAKHRTGITDPSDYQDFLQADAAINPGNSGGPLLTLRGRVIGINSMIASQSGGFEGIGFAIPGNMALHVAKALIAHGQVARGWLGIGTQDLTPDLAKSFGLTLPKGTLVAEVQKGGPADKAGFRKGDIIIAYQDKKIADASSFRNEVANSSIGGDVQVSVWRDGKKQTLTVKVGNLDQAKKIVVSELKDRLGIMVRPLTVKEAETYGLTLPKGVAISWVDPGGAFGKIGFEVDDVILALDNHPIPGADSFNTIMTAMPHHQRLVLLAINHNTGQTANVSVKLP
jgi:serine protease Do